MEQTPKTRKNNGVIVTNKEQIQSYIFTTAKYDFNVYEKRLLYRLVEMAQCETQGLHFPDDCRRIDHNLWGKVLITLPVASLLSSEEDKNYAKAKKALDSLSEKKFYYEDNKVWEKLCIIVSPKIQKYKNTMTFEIEPRIWDVILDFSKGFRKYELVTAMNFKSVYSMRFYELMSGQETKLTYSLESLKEMFQVQNKYKLTADFLRYVIEPAKKELDESSPYSFEWSVNKEGRKITSINFYPVFKEERRDPALVKNEQNQQLALSWDLNGQVVRYLTDSIGFTKIELKNNKDLIIEAQTNIPDILAELALLKGKSREKANPKGWIINALKGKLKDLRGESVQDLDRPTAPPMADFSKILKKVN